MELSIAEAARILGLSERTMRARVARGDIAGRRQGRVWMVELRDLPLNEAQRQGLQARAEQLRADVDSVLPGRQAQTLGDTRRSLTDLDAFRRVYDALTLLRELPDAPPHATAHLEEALRNIGEASFVWDRETRLAALTRARAALGRVAADLLVQARGAPATPVVRLLQQLEHVALPAVGGLSRWAASLRRDRP